MVVLNGEQVNTTEQNGSILLTLDKSGNYQISVLDLWPSNGDQL